MADTGSHKQCSGCKAKVDSSSADANTKDAAVNGKDDKKEQKAPKKLLWQILARTNDALVARPQRLRMETTHDASHASAPLSSGSSFNRRNCPALTDTEKSLLRVHRGCLKCRVPYVDHISKNCPTGFPNPDTCVPVTKAICLAAKNGNTAAAAAAPTAPAAKPPAVAVVMRPIDVVEDSDDSATDDEFEVSLPTPPSHRTEHLFWECLVDGPAALSSLLILALIDHGAHLALIDDALVTKLGLRQRKLREPKPISLAMSDESSEPQYLTEYVKLRLVSKDQAWVSNTAYRG
ncbi:hypothetical protein C8R43DRAFT_1150989 [Mycena crocata]|nr:hypothetical protein C8R43DRAFT_1150989 [Mycena crocata]